MAKTELQEETDWSTSILGQMDSLMFFSYSLCQFFFARAGDHFDKNKVLTVSFITQGICFLCLGLQEYYEQNVKSVYYFCWLVVGISQSIVFPILVSVIGSWFPRTTRGRVTGGWATCTNVGDIIGQ